MFWNYCSNPPFPVVLEGLACSSPMTVTSGIPIAATALSLILVFPPWRLEMESACKAPSLVCLWKGEVLGREWITSGLIYSLCKWKWASRSYWWLNILVHETSTTHLGSSVEELKATSNTWIKMNKYKPRYLHPMVPQPKDLQTRNTGLGRTMKSGKYSHLMMLSLKLAPLNLHG